MSEIVLAYNVTPNALSELAQGVNAYLRRCPWKEVRSVTRGLVTSFCIGRGGDQVRSYLGADGRELFLLGQIDTRDLPLDPSLPDADLRYVHTCLCEGNQGKVAELPGRYALFAAEPNALQSFTDPFGSKHVYWSSCGEGVVFSSVLSVLTRSSTLPRKLDPVGVAEALCLGYQLEGRTMYQGVSLLPERSQGRVVRGSLILTRGSVGFPCRDACCSWGDAVEEMHHLMLDAFKAQLPREPGSCLVPLSGGFDSRFIAAMATNAGLNPRFSTYGIPGCADLKVASQVAAALGTRTAAYTNDADYLARRWMDPFILNGSLCAPNISVFVDYLENVGRHDNPLYVSGYLGDVISSAKKRVKVVDGKILTAEEFFGISEIPAVVLDKEIGEAAGNIGSTLLRIREGIDGDEYHKDNYLDIITRQRKYISFQLRLMEAYGRVIAPYEDMPLFRFFSRLPYMALENQELYKRVMKAKYPHLARIPNANDGEPIVPSLSFLLPEYLKSKVKRLLGVKDQERFRYPVDHSEALSANGGAIVREKLLANPLLKGLFDLEKVNALAKPPLGYQTNTWKLLALLQVAEAREALAGQAN